MAIIRPTCKYCGKSSDLTEIDMGSSKLLIFKCGHSYVEQKLSGGEWETNERVEQNLGISDEYKKEILSIFEQLKKAVPEKCDQHPERPNGCIKTLESRSGKHLFPFQRDGVVAAFLNNAKFIFNDEMGLGKTAQALCTILLNKEELLPALFVCKSIAKTNMLWEVMDWLQVPAQVIYKTMETPWDMFPVHIISYDMMNRLDKLFRFSDMKAQLECPSCKFRCDEGQFEFCPECLKNKRAEGDRKQETVRQGNLLITDIKTRIVDKLGEKIRLEPWIDKSLGLGALTLKDENKIAWTGIIKRCKTIILDEVHLLKNPDTQRSKALKACASLIPHRLPLSGTLIKNNATEYFVPMNIVKPEKHWRFESFNRNNVRFEAVRTVTGKIANKYTGLINPARFLEDNKDIMIRRTTDQVMPDLPKLFRQQKYVELEERMQELYDKSEGEFAEWFDNASAMELATDILAKLAILRHQTSLAKVDYTIDLALEFIMTTERKLAIFTHHIDSREFLATRMMEFFRKTNNPEDKPELDYLTNVVRVLGRGKDVQKEIEDFKSSPTERIIILSTLSHGESINLQFMSDCILHERQWNPANEDQAISGRFRRIGQEAKSITCLIPVAIGTIDEYYVDINEHKRAIGSELENGITEYWNQGFVAELASKIAEKGRKKWKL